MSVMDVQHGGDHYKCVPAGYQPIEIAEKLGLSATEFSVLKYLLRYKKKSGLVDLKKMMHFGQMLIKMHYGVETAVTYQETASESEDSWKAVEASESVIPQEASGNLKEASRILEEALRGLQASVPPARIGKLWLPQLPPEVLLAPAGQSVDEQKEALREALGVPQPTPDPAAARVTQDRVPARPDVDEFRWSSWSESSEWLVVDTWVSACGKMHGHEDDGDILSLRCRPEDLPPLTPPLDWHDPVKKGGPADHLLPEKRDYPGPSVDFPSVMDEQPF